MDSLNWRKTESLCLESNLLTIRPVLLSENPLMSSTGQSILINSFSVGSVSALYSVSFTSGLVTLIDRLKVKQSRSVILSVLDARLPDFD